MIKKYDKRNKEKRKKKTIDKKIGSFRTHSSEQI